MVLYITMNISFKAILGYTFLALYQAKILAVFRLWRDQVSISLTNRNKSRN